MPDRNTNWELALPIRFRAFGGDSFAFVEAGPAMRYAIAPSTDGSGFTSKLQNGYVAAFGIHLGAFEIAYGVDSPSPALFRNAPSARTAIAARMVLTEPF